MAGMPGTTPSAILLAMARHSSPVLAWKFQSGLSGLAMNFCISGLMSAVGTCRVLAGTCRGVIAASAAKAAIGMADASAAATIVIAVFMVCLSRVGFQGSALCRTGITCVSDVPFSSAMMSDIIGTKSSPWPVPTASAKLLRTAAPTGLATPSACAKPAR